MGIKKENIRWHQHENLVFYAQDAWDIEYRFPFGFKELEGVHYRTDYDLSQHSKVSGAKLQYRDPKTNEVFTPHVIETSVGVDRTFLALLTEAYQSEELANGGTRAVLKLPAFLAPIKIAIFPLKNDWMCEFDDNGNIGKRYRRQDEIGTPYCVTVDFDSLNDNSVTVRERDTMEQVRVKTEELKNWFQTKNLSL